MRALLMTIILLTFSGFAQAQGSEELVPIDEGGPVLVTMALLDVDAINSVDQSFTINLYMHFRWRDTRLVHPGEGLRRANLGNIPAPRFVLLNRQRTWSTLAEIVDISPEGEALYRMRVWGDFSQPLDLRHFPFDSHSFEIPVIALSTDSERGYIPLLSDPQTPSKIADNFSVADWEITGWQVGSDVGNVGYDAQSPRYLFAFEARRIYNHYLIKFVIPLVLIVMMSWVVFWIDPVESGSQLSVAVTVVLTLIAYHIALSNKLPDIPYLTRMDFFLFGSTLLVFSSLIEVVTTSHYVSVQRVELARRIDAICRIAFPLAYLAVASWSLNVN